MKRTNLKMRLFYGHEYNGTDSRLRSRALEKSFKPSNLQIWKKAPLPAQCTVIWKRSQIIGFRKLIKAMLREPCTIHAIRDTRYPRLTVALRVQRDKHTANFQQQCESLWLMEVQKNGEGCWPFTTLPTTHQHREAALKTNVWRSGWCTPAKLEKSDFATKVGASLLPRRVRHASRNTLCECSEFNCFYRIRIVPPYLCEEYTEGGKGKWKPR